MTLEEISELIEKTDTIYEPHRIRKGLEILEKYVDKDVEINFWHSVMYVMNADPECMQKEDIIRLAQLGWWVDTEVSCWGHY